MRINGAIFFGMIIFVSCFALVVVGYYSKKIIVKPEIIELHFGKQGVKEFQHDSSNEDRYYADGRVPIHFGMQGLKDFSRFNYGNMQHHPAGMDFMKLQWNAPELGKVKIITKKSNFDINNVIYVLGTQVSRYEDDGVQTITVIGSLNYEEYVTSIAAYEAYIALVKEFNRKGWQQYYFLGEARIDKRDNLKHIKESLGGVIDPTYLFTYDEWREFVSEASMGRLKFKLFQDEVYVTITIDREYQENGKEQYKVRYSFVSQKYSILNDISGSDKMTKEELAEAYHKGSISDNEVRVKREKDRLEEGYRIDESYIDHDVWQYLK